MEDNSVKLYQYYGMEIKPQHVPMGHTELWVDYMRRREPLVNPFSLLDGEIQQNFSDHPLYDSSKRLGVGVSGMGKTYYLYFWRASEKNHISLKRDVTDKVERDSQGYISKWKEACLKLGMPFVEPKWETVWVCQDPKYRQNE